MAFNMDPHDPGSADNRDAVYYRLGRSTASDTILACLAGIALWNAMEIILVTYLAYRRLRTLYFWSILASAFGVIICTISQIVNLWVEWRSDLVPNMLGGVGWVPMVTGQSLVLYSRLHMLYINTRILRLVLAMIIIDAVILHSTVIVLSAGASSNNPRPYLLPFSISEKLEVTVFFAQESVLSGLYIWASHKFLRKHAHQLQDSHDQNMRVVKGILRSLITVSLIVILLDIAILVLEYVGLHIHQLSVKNFVYSVKLKVELGVLDQLKDFVKRTGSFPLIERLQHGQLERENIQSQWEAALRRAFGTISRSLARTRSVGPNIWTLGHQTQANTVESHRSQTSLAPAQMEQRDYFNVEVRLSTINMRKSPVEQDTSSTTVVEA